MNPPPPPVDRHAMMQKGLGDPIRLPAWTNDLALALSIIAILVGVLGMVFS